MLVAVSILHTSNASSLPFNGQSPDLAITYAQTNALVSDNVGSTQASFPQDHNGTSLQSGTEIDRLKRKLDGKSESDSSISAKSSEIDELKNRLSETNASNARLLADKSKEVDELQDRLNEANSASARLIAEKSNEVEELKNRLSESSLANARLRAEIDDMKRHFSSNKSIDSSEIAPALAEIAQQDNSARVLRSSAPLLMQDTLEAIQPESGSFDVETVQGGEHKDLAEQVRTQIKKFFATKDERFWKKTYEKHLKGHDQLSRENFRLAFRDLGIFLDEEGEREVFEGADSDQDQSLDFNEFLTAIKKPSTIEQWTAGLPLTKLVAAAFVPIIRQSKYKEDPLIALSECSAQVLSLALGVLKDGLNELLWKHISELKTGYCALKSLNLESQGPQANSKFSIGEVGTMSCGKINDFYGGLGTRVGL